jgi:hypothetical protein
MKKLLLVPASLISFFLLTLSGCSLAGSNKTIVKGFFLLLHLIA